MGSIDLEDAISQADQIYRERSGARSAQAAIDLLIGAAGSENEYDAQWRLARAMFLAGEGDSTYFRTGSSRGLKAASLNPHGVEGHFWAGVNLALAAGQIGGIRGALLLLKSRRHLKQAVTICESYHSAGPLRVLGRLYHKAPRFLGGSSKLSRECYERALAIAPNNSVTLLYAAELATSSGENDRGIELLRRIEALDPDPDWVFEIERDKSLARTLLNKIGAA